MIGLAIGWTVVLTGLSALLFHISLQRFNPLAFGLGCIVASNAVFMGIFCYDKLFWG